MKSQDKIVSVEVRGISINLMGYTRSLELCARMNYETENLDFIDKMLPGDILYDLGSCEGRFSIYAALKGLRVFAFEPERRNYKVLNENLILNSILNDKVQTYNVAVGDSDKIGIIKVGQPWEGGHQKIVQHDKIREDLNFTFQEEQSIKIVALDSFVVSEKLPRPTYFKIDIDGSEMPFLNGSKETLSDKSLRGLIFELDKADQYYSEILNTLSDAGFSPDREFQIPNEADLFNIIFLRNN